MHRYSTLTVAVSTAALALLTGCGRKVASPPPLEVAVRFLPVAPRRCIPSVEIPPADARVARLCAEAFVRQNGYTPERARGDTLLLVRERFEIGIPWNLLIDKRRYTIEAKAAFPICDPSGCLVYFHRFQRRLGCLVVMLSGDYDDLHLGLPSDSELARRRCG